MCSDHLSPSQTRRSAPWCWWVRSTAHRWQQCPAEWTRLQTRWRESQWLCSSSSPPPSRWRQSPSGFSIRMSWYYWDTLLVSFAINTPLKSQGAQSHLLWAFLVFHCVFLTDKGTDRIYHRRPYVIQIQWKANNAPNRGLWVPWEVYLWHELPATESLRNITAWRWNSLIFSAGTRDSDSPTMVRWGPSNFLWLVWTPPIALEWSNLSRNLSHPQKLA